MPRVVFYCNQWLRQLYITSAGVFSAEKDNYIQTLKRTREHKNKNFEILIEVRKNPQVPTALLFLDQMNHQQLIKEFSYESNTIHVHFIAHLETSKQIKQQIVKLNKLQVLQLQSLLESRINYDPLSYEKNQKVSIPLQRNGNSYTCLLSNISSGKGIKGIKHRSIAKFHTYQHDKPHNSNLQKQKTIKNQPSQCKIQFQKRY